ncbi:MAG: response regulator [Pirellulales bacterium]|nr:response regulator [Pirellulales bacterium]
MRHVLLVEDDPLSRTVVEDMFHYQDVPGELVCVESGEEALAAIPVFNPLLILMDIRLPGISGIEATKAIKSNPSTKHIRVWAITALGTRADIEAALAAGCDAYFVKPINATKLACQLQGFFKYLPPELTTSERETAAP